MVTLVYLVYKLFPLFDLCISQHLCHFILEAFFLFILTVFNMLIVLILVQSLITELLFLFVCLFIFQPYTCSYTLVIIPLKMLAPTVLTNWYIMLHLQKFLFFVLFFVLFFETIIFFNTHFRTSFFFLAYQQS